MLFGPIAALEMVTSARRARYFIVRVGYALVLLVVLWLNYTATWGSAAADGTLSIHKAAEFSANFFGTFIFVQLSAVLLLTPAMIAGSIAQERERRTIEYMLASTLTGGEIVLSKFLVRTLHVAALLLAGLPLLAIAMMLGGIDPRRLLIAFVMTLATLIATAALSIATSVWSKRSRDAVVRTYVLLIAFLVLPPLVMSLAGSVWSWLDWLPALGGALSQANPYYVLAVAVYGVAPATALPPLSPWEPVWPFLAVYAAFSIVVLVWSMASVRRVYRKSIGASESVRWLARYRRRWRPRLGNYPMLWKELFAATAAFHLGMLGRVALVLLCAAAIVPALVIFYQTVTSATGASPPDTVYVGQFVATALWCAALIVVTIRAAGSISAEKERDTWVSLVSTPLTPGEIIWAKIAGSIYAARWFALPVGVWWLLATLLKPEFALVIPVILATFGCIALATGAIGVWFSAWCRASIRAMAGAVAVAIFLGGGYLMCCLPLLFHGGSDDNQIFALSPCIPFLLGTPGTLWMQFLDQANFGGTIVKVAYAYLFGTGCYLAAGLVLAAINVGQFDDRVGRPSGRKSAGRSPV